MEKTEKATPKRKQDERKKGNIFQSKELTTVVSLLTMFYTLSFWGPNILGALQSCIAYFLEASANPELLTMGDLSAVFIEGAATFAISALPLLLVAGLVAVVVTMLQTRMLFTFEAISFKLDKLNPFTGLKRLFSLRSLVELAKSLLKIMVLAYIIYTTFTKELAGMPRMMDMTAMDALSYTGSIVLSIARTAAIVMVAVAAFDYFYQWWDYEKQLRMSKQELKEEYKQTEGDPQVKGKIRERQQQMSRQRMMQAVPTADVVIRNPTHYAVAIRYEPGKDLAPMVVAKGADNLALRIIKVAEENDVFITENRPLARALYEAVELEQVIPEQYYQPIAEVLAFVYNLKKKDLTL